MSKGPFHCQSSMILLGQVLLLGLGKCQEDGQGSSLINLALACLPSLLPQLSEDKENGQ